MQLFLSILGYIAMAIFMYQIFYLIVGLFCKPRVFTESNKNRFAVLISARNEESVIAHLISSIKGQSYPSELVDIYVVADNCTDKTAEVARNCGVTVYERLNKKQIGKGYALDLLLKNITKLKGSDYYDGFFVFDADNILEPDFIEQMNKTFSSGYKIVTSYRNSKNFDTNWITSGYAIWFLREARYMNNSRQILNTSCTVAGTGFLFHRDMLKDGSWKWHLMSEDTEFTADTIINGEKVGYCHAAMLYDEQPETFKHSWNQRMRWARGSLQVFKHYGWRLFKGIFKNKSKNRFSHFDVLITVIPMIFLMMAAIVGMFYGIFAAIPYGTKAVLDSVISAGCTLFGFYLTFFLMGVCAVITEWRSINSTNGKKVKYLFSFPLFMLTWIPIGLVALFKKVQWAQIPHKVGMGIDEIKNQK